MADEKEELLFEVKIDRGDSEKEIDRLTESIEKTKMETKELTAANKELAKTGKANTKEYNDNAKQIELNRQSLSKNNSTRKNAIAAIKSEDNSLGALKTRLSENKKARDQVNLSTIQGRKEFDRLTKSIKADNDALLNAEKAAGQYSRQVGNYGEALNTVSPAAAGVVTQVKAMTKAALAFVATPLGAVLAAIALVLAPLVGFFKNTQEGMDQVDQAGAALSATFGVLTDVFSNIGRVIIGLATGTLSLKEAFTEFKGALTGVTDEIFKQANAAVQIEKDFQALRRVEDELIVTQAKRRVQLEETKNAIEDLSLSLTERIELTEKAKDISNDIARDEEIIAKRRLELTKQQNSLSESTQEDIRKERDLEVELINIRAASLAQQKEFITKGVALRNEAAKSRETTQIELDDREIELFELKEVTKLEISERLAVLGTQVEQRELKNRTALQKNASKLAIDIKKAETQAYITSLGILTNAVAGFASEQSLIGKGLALFNIGLSSAEAIAKGTAASQSLPFPGNLIATATTIATVLSNIARAKSLLSSTSTPKFAHGGALEIGGKSHAQGGTHFYGSDGTRFEAEKGENLYILNRRASAKINALSNINAAYGGTSFGAGKSYLATGGQVQRATSSVNSTTQLIRGITEAITKMPVVVTVEDINAGIGRSNDTMNKAQII